MDILFSTRGRKATSLIFIIALVCAIAGRSWAQAPAAAEAPPAAAGASGTVDMEADVFGEVLSRIGLNPDDFGGKVPVGGKPGAARAAAEAKKEEEPEGEELQPAEEETTQEPPPEEPETPATETGELNLAELGLTEEQQTAVAQLFEKAKVIAPDAAKLQTDLAAVQAENTRLQTELTGKKPQSVAIAKIHPIFELNDAQKLADREREIMHFEKWVMDNWDGTEEIPAQGDKPAIPAFTAKEIRSRYAEMKQEREVWIPRARQQLDRQRECDTVAYAAYPELKDTKSPEHQIFQNIIAQAPALATVFPNIKMIIGDAIVGEKLRRAKEQSKPAKPGAAAAAGAAGAAKPVPAAPKLPMGGKPSKPAATSQPRKTGTIDVKEFDKRGGSRDALRDLIAESMLVNN